MSTEDDLIQKIKTLSDTVWDRRAKQPAIDEWLENFQGRKHDAASERLHALFLLSNFLYFGSRQIRELLRAVYRDLYRYPIIEDIRRSHGDTLDTSTILSYYRKALDRTMFLGVGNPSESGSHLLYYFRQENGLPKTLFAHVHEIFERKRLSKWRLLWNLLTHWGDPTHGTLNLRHPNIDRYVFLDDFCGSGHQGVGYSRGIVDDIKLLNPAAKVLYFVLFATRHGMDVLRSHTSFDSVQCVFELDDSYRCFDLNSRYFIATPAGISKFTAEEMCRFYGNDLCAAAELGYGDCQLLIGFHHNTPDNTLPIFWYDEPNGSPWVPIFKRYPKLYG